MTRYGEHLIDNRTVPAVEVAGDTANEEIVLGRDVINQLLLLMDGPLATTSILDKHPR